MSEMIFELLHSLKKICDRKKKVVPFSISSYKVGNNTGRDDIIEEYEDRNSFISCKKLPKMIDNDHLIYNNLNYQICCKISRFSNASIFNFKIF